MDEPTSFRDWPPLPESHFIGPPPPSPRRLLGEAGLGLTTLYRAPDDVFGRVR